jgi:hypothetical protein
LPVGAQSCFRWDVGGGGRRKFGSSVATQDNFKFEDEMRQH